MGVKQTHKPTIIFSAIYVPSKQLSNFRKNFYYHFTTIGAETGSFRAIRAVFSERKFFHDIDEKFVCKFTTQAEDVVRTPRSVVEYFANFYYHLILWFFASA